MGVAPKRPIYVNNDWCVLLLCIYLCPQTTPRTVISCVVIDGADVARRHVGPAAVVRRSVVIHDAVARQLHHFLLDEGSSRLAW